MRRAFCTAAFTLLLIMIVQTGIASTTAITCGIVAKSNLELRPLQLNQRDAVTITDLVYEGLFTLDDDYMPQPELAYSYEFTNEGRRLIVTLRSDVTFHNGKKLTSSDVIATLDAMYQLSGFDNDLNSEVELADRGLYYSTFYSIRSWEAQGDDIIVFTLRRTSYGALYALTFPVLPSEEVFSVMPSGTGPYRYDAYEPGMGIWLTLNQGWWKRTPQVRSIRANIYSNDETVMNAFDQRAVDIAFSRSINASRYSGSLNSFSLSARTRQLEVLLVNRSQTLFKSDDKGENLVRKAVSYAINRSELINSIYQGMATVAYTPVPTGTWLTDESTIQDIYDPLMAASLLDSAGWKLANDGKRYKDGKAMPTLRLLVYDEVNSTVRTNAANKIREQLQAVGFSVSVVTWSREDVQVKLRSGDFYLALAAFSFDICPDPGFTVSSTGSCNFTRYRSDEMNELVAQLRKSYLAQDYQTVMKDIQNKFLVDLPYLPLYWRTGAVLSRSAFTNARDIREQEQLRGIEALSD